MGQRPIGQAEWLGKGQRRKAVCKLAEAGHKGGTAKDGSLKVLDSSGIASLCLIGDPDGVIS